MRHLVVVALAVLVAVGAGWALRPDRRPNVVLVLVDTLRRDRVGVYGYASPTTPWLDAVAAEGVVFDNAWSHAPQTFNSTASLLTSRTLPVLQYERRRPPEPHQSPILAARGLTEDDRTLASAIADGGYDTFAVFTNPHHHEHSSFQRGFRRWTYLTPKEGGAFAAGDEVNAAVRDLLARRDPERPFFAYVHYMDVHYPYDAPEEIVRRFVTTEGRDLYTNGRPLPEYEPTPDDVRFMSERYDAAIRHLDDQLRELFAITASLDSERPTVVVITSDHGEEFMEHGGLGHGHSAHPELLRVPLVLHGAPVAAGTRVASLARGIDVGPTVLDLAGVAAPAEFEGRSLLVAARAAASGDEPPRRTAEVEDASFAWHGHVRGLTTERFHVAIDREHDEQVMYALRTADEARALRVGRAGTMRRRLGRFVKRYEGRLFASLARASQMAVDADLLPVPVERREQLRALGYVD